MKIEPLNSYTMRKHNSKSTKNEMNQHIPLKNNFKIYWLQVANQNEGASGNMIYLSHSQGVYLTL